MTTVIVTHSTPSAPDPVQIHARAVNSLALALHYLRQPATDLRGASRKASQALAALDLLHTTQGRA